MRVVIVTSSRMGTASYFLPYLAAIPEVEVVKVILSKNIIINKKGFYRKKLKKIFKIGMGGALNGIRMRKWFSEDVNNITGVLDIASLCEIYKIPLAETDSINNDFTVEQMISANADIGISLGNGYLASKVFSIPKYGMINLHGELLPDYQNAQSVIWQIYNGSSVTGYTIHKINKNIDAGDVLKQEIFPIIFREKLRETIAVTCAEIQRRAAIGMVEVLKDIDGHLAKAIVQGDGTSYTTPNISQFLRILVNHRKMSNKLENKNE